MRLELDFVSGIEKIMFHNLSGGQRTFTPVLQIQNMNLTRVTLLPLYHSRVLCAVCLFLTTCVRPAIGVAAAPKLRDVQHRFDISLFAEAPQIVNPIGLQVDQAGHVFVIESHTHFPPHDYKGPKADRILPVACASRFL